MKSLTLHTAPTVEPVTLAEAKAWARISTDDDDALLDALIAGARASAEEFMRRSLITQTWKLTLDQACNRQYDQLGDGVYDLPVTALYGGLPASIHLPKGPVSAITSVTTYDLDNTSSVFSSASYSLDTAGQRLYLNNSYTWPTSLRPIAACEILYVAGYGATAATVPQPIKSAMMIHVATLYEQRGQCEDAMSIPAGAKHLYNQYRIMGRD